MLWCESVKSRLDREQSLSFLEFNYMIPQAYDFLELFRREGCRLQMGGSDQWGNIVNDVDLTRRVLGGEVYGLVVDGYVLPESPGPAIAGGRAAPLPLLIGSTTTNTRRSHPRPACRQRRLAMKRRCARASA